MSIGRAGAAVSDMNNLYVPAQNSQTRYNQQDSTSTQVVVHKLQHTVPSVQQQLHKSQLESRAASNQQLAKSNLLLAYFGKPDDTAVDTWDDGNPLMAQAVSLQNNSKQSLQVATTHKGSGGGIQRGNMTSSLDYG